MEEIWLVRDSHDGFIFHIDENGPFTEKSAKEFAEWRNANMRVPTYSVGRFVEADKE